jgi:hypothetical protein
MPIKPEMKGVYRGDWPEISRRVRFERGAGILFAVCPMGAGSIPPAIPGGTRRPHYNLSRDLLGDLKSLKIEARRLVAIEASREWLLKHEVRL